MISTNPRISTAISSYVLEELDVTAVSEDECYRKWLQMFPHLESHHDFLGGFMKEKKICTQQKKRDQGHCQVGNKWVTIQRWVVVNG